MKFVVRLCLTQTVLLAELPKHKPKKTIVMAKRTPERSRAPTFTKNYKQLKSSESGEDNAPQERTLLIIYYQMVTPEKFI